MRKRRRVLVALAGLVGMLGLFGLFGLAGARWYSTTRPENRLRRGQEALRQGDWEEADRLALLLEDGGAPDHARLLRGEALFRRRAYLRALAEFNRIRDRGELRLHAAALSGQCLFFLGQLHEAERVLHFVLDHWPDHSDAHRTLAALYYDQGAVRRSLRHLEEVARLDPQDGRPHRHMGFIYKDLNQHPQAIECYREALRRELTPRVASEVAAELGECLVKRREYAPALEALEQCGPPVDETAEVLALRAEALGALGRAEEARDLLARALTRHPRAPELLRAQAQLHLDADRPEAAVPLLHRALEADPHEHRSRYHLALAYARLGRPADAAEQRRLLKETEAHLQELSQLSQQADANPWDAAVRRRLEAVCQRLNKPDLAALWRRAAARAETGGAQPAK